jgi:hypothetical protein
MPKNFHELQTTFPTIYTQNSKQKLLTQQLPSLWRMFCPIFAINIYSPTYQLFFHTGKKRKVLFALANVEL